MAKHKLVVDFEYDFALIGISCHGRDYQMCWAINQQLQLKLSREGEDIEKKIKGNMCNFSSYLFFDDEYESTFRLVANKAEGGFLVSEFKQCDFFIIIEGAQADNVENYCEELNKVKMIQLAFILDPNSLKSKDNLLF